MDSGISENFPAKSQIAYIFNYSETYVETMRILVGGRENYQQYRQIIIYLYI